MAAGRLNREVEQLEEIAYGLTVLEKEISYGHTRLPQALELAARGLKGIAGSVFRLAGVAITEQEITPYQAFTVALDSVPSWEAESARPVLLRLAEELGASSISEQERFLKLAQEEIGAQRERAREKASSQGKVYRWGGFLVGGMLTLLLI